MLYTPLKLEKPPSTGRTTPESLYACQLEDRHARGIWLNNL